MLKRIILKKILTALVFPVSLFSLICFWFSYKLLTNTVTKKIKIIFICAFTLFFLLTMPPISSLLVNSLEKKYPCLLDSNKIKEADYIIILGGGYTDAENMPESNQLGSSSLARLVEAIRLKNINKKAQLIFSGGKPYTEKFSEASIYQKAYKSLTNDTSVQILSELPHNTKSEADEAYKIVGNKKTILITSATHMPRAIYLFSKMGCNVIASPCDFFVKNIKPYPNFPSGMSIKQTEITIHEYIGILGYKLFD